MGTGNTYNKKSLSVIVCLAGLLTAFSAVGVQAQITTTSTSTTILSPTTTIIPTVSETFETFDPAKWTIVSNQPGTGMEWSITDQHTAGSVQNGKTYPANLQTAMIYGPVDLSEKKSAEIYFSILRDMEWDYSWLGFAVLPHVTNFSDLSNIDWVYSHMELTTWFEGNSGGIPEWEPQWINISGYAGKTIYIVWFFESQGTGSSTKSGAFVDNVWLYAYTEEWVDPYTNDFVNWELLSSESFDTLDLSFDPKWFRFISSPDPNLLWTVTDVRKDDGSNPSSTKSLSVVRPGNGYPVMTSWLLYGPIDLTTMPADASQKIAYADMNFSLIYDLNVNAFIAFGAGIISDPSVLNSPFQPENVFDPDYFEWRLGGNGYWENVYIDLTPFVGSNHVYLAWYFQSDAPSVSNQQGMFIDEVQVWAQPDTVNPIVNFISEGLWIDASFDTLSSWNFKDVGTGDTGSCEITRIDGNEVAMISGNQVLFKTFEAANDLVDLMIRFDYSMRTDETNSGTDRFCVSIADAAQPLTPLIDFGCWDVTDFPDSYDNWMFDRFERSLSPEQISRLKTAVSQGKQMAIVIQLIQDSVHETWLYIDQFSVYATGGKSRPDQVDQTIADSRDKNEPNDSFETATAVTCGKTISGVFGDVGGGFDLDFFVLKAPAGSITIDINAKSKRPSSKADTYIELYDSKRNLIGFNDDEEGGNTLDSKLIFKNTTNHAVYYVVVGTWSGGGADYFYDLHVTCTDQELQTLKNSQAIPVERFSDRLRQSSTEKDWTVMLYLNAEDQNCVKSGKQSDCWTEIYEESIRRIETFIGDKQAYLNVVAFIDGPNFGGAEKDVMRYVIQPNGNYTIGVNKWNLEEVNMGDPKTLSDFAIWAIKNYPAKNYYLSIDNHGNGILGISWDYHDKGGAEIKGGDQLTPAELRTAMKEISMNLPRSKSQIDILDYEACLMGMIENAYDVKDYVRYLAFFQPISWTSFNYPEYLNDLKQSDDALTFAKRVIDKYPVGGTSSPYTFSLIDTSQLTALRDKIDAFAKALMNSDRLDDIKAVRDESQAFNGNPEKGKASQDHYGYIDLSNFADKVTAKGIAAPEAEAVKQAINAAVIKKDNENTKLSGIVKGVEWNYMNSHGLSILFPAKAYTFIQDYWRNYQMSHDGLWDEFLTEYVFKGYNFERNTVPLLTGDVNCNGTVELDDAILAFKIAINLSVPLNPRLNVTAVDANNDGKIGIEEALYVIQTVSRNRVLSRSVNDRQTTSIERLSNAPELPQVKPATTTTLPNG